MTINVLRYSAGGKTGVLANAVNMSDATGLFLGAGVAVKTTIPVNATDTARICLVTPQNLAESYLIAAGDQTATIAIPDGGTPEIVYAFEMLSGVEMFSVPDGATELTFLSKNDQELYITWYL